MPIYLYACLDCKLEQEEFQRITSDSLVLCPRCVSKTYHRKPTLPHTSMQAYHTPIELYSIAMETDEEIREFMKKAPDVHVSTDPDDDMYGVPVAASRYQKLQALKSAGFVEGK